MNLIHCFWIQHADDKHQGALIHRLSSLMTPFSLPVWLCLMFRSLFQWGELAFLAPCITLPRHGKALSAYFPLTDFSVLLRPPAAHPSDPCHPLTSFSACLWSLTLAVTLLQSRSVLGGSTAHWSWSQGRRWWTRCRAHGFNSQQGRVLHSCFFRLDLRACYLLLLL